MKTPIEPSQIRACDVIRWEQDKAAPGAWRAEEYVATKDGDAYLRSGRHYLVAPRSTAVPTTALDDLRAAELDAALADVSDHEHMNRVRRDAIATFLKAVKPPLPRRAT